MNRDWFMKLKLMINFMKLLMTLTFPNCPVAESMPKEEDKVGGSSWSKFKS